MRCSTTFETGSAGRRVIRAGETALLNCGRRLRCRRSPARCSHCRSRRSCFRRSRCLRSRSQSNYDRRWLCRPSRCRRCSASRPARPRLMLSPAVRPCCPALLLPPLAAAEIAAPLSRPVSSVVVASSEISAPLPPSADTPGTLAELPRTSGCVPAASSRRRRARARWSRRCR
jgi:hypothetical protein